MMHKVYGGECLPYPIIDEWCKRFKEGREDLNDDELLGRTRSVVNEENVEFVCEFIKKSRNLYSIGPNGQCCVLYWCYKAFTGAYSSCAARIS